MSLDWGRLAAFHRALELSNSLKLWGIPAVITHGIPFMNGYEEVMAEGEFSYPEDNGDPNTADATCLVLMDHPLDGLNDMNDTISISDKLEEQFVITTNAELQLEDLLTMTYPDGRVLRLRITEQLAKHGLTALVYKYVGVVY